MKKKSNQNCKNFVRPNPRLSQQQDQYQYQNYRNLGHGFALLIAIP